MIEIIPVGGYSEVGRNSVIVKYNDEAVMLDCGLKMEEYIELSENDAIPDKKPRGTLMRNEAIPNIKPVREELKNIKAVAVSHAHLDHVGALPFLVDEIKAPVHATDFTINVLKAQLEDKGKRFDDLHSHESNSRFSVSENIDLEFIHVKHSTPQTVVIVVHTPDGSVVYANEFRFDDTPLLGEKPNYEGLENIENPKALILDSLYVNKDRHTPSEVKAKEELKEIIIEGNTKNKNIVVTTFASHLERIKSIVDVSKEVGRRPVFIGRSLAKYMDAAKDAGIIEFENQAGMVKSGGKVQNYFDNMKKTKDKVFITTGHQGEPKAILSRITDEDIFPFEEGDIVIFSSKIIPIEESYKNRAILEEKLEKKGVNIYTDVHVSGHAARKDHKRLVDLIKPEHLVPTHGDREMLEEFKDMTVSMGYDADNVHVLRNFNNLYLE